MGGGKVAGSRYRFSINRGPEKLSHPGQFGMGVLQGDGVSGNDDWICSLDQHFRRFLNRLRRGGQTGIKACRGPEIDFPFGVEHIHGEGDKDGPRRIRESHFCSPVYGPGQVF